ncbi:uncharacterized protein LOC104422895 isoform X1 [Eucalyptus grandis]|uniref:uncharacterized protein LOC104422895 isoform X1 n=1 Tax=Eucalyptus grandis TaxID=71139 RepID=UPI00192EE583|nr:uncharacterized protein LOC104422895 isoform X1 [Eucalyptus grandis]
MAATCSTSPRLILWDSSQITRRVGSVAMLMRSRIPINRVTAVRTRSSLKNQVHTVFEDQCEGIVCYRDESGEIICEGYDEGPRFGRKILRTTYRYEARDAEIIDLLQRNWLQIAEDGALYKVEVGDILQEDLS